MAYDGVTSHYKNANTHMNIRIQILSLKALQPFIQKFAPSKIASYMVCGETVILKINVTTTAMIDGCNVVAR